MSRYIRIAGGEVQEMPVLQEWKRIRSFIDLPRVRWAGAKRVLHIRDQGEVRGRTGNDECQCPLARWSNDVQQRIAVYGPSDEPLGLPPLRFGANELKLLGFRAPF